MIKRLGQAISAVEPRLREDKKKKGIFLKPTHQHYGTMIPGDPEQDSEWKGLAAAR